MSDQANLEYVKIETFPLAVFPHLQPIYVTNGLNSIRKSYQAYFYFEIIIIRLPITKIKQFSIIYAFTAL